MLQLWFIANTVLWPFNLKLGGFTLTLNVVLLLLSGVIWIWRKRQVASSTVKVLLVLWIFFGVSMLVALNSPCNDKFLKSAITTPIIGLLIPLGWEIGRKADTREWIRLQKMAQFALAMAFTAFFLEAAFPALWKAQSNYRVEGKLSGLFQEPSNVAFSLFPCIAILLVAESKSVRRRGMLAFWGLLICSRSSTLVALAAAWVAYQFLVRKQMRNAILPFVGVVLLIGLAAIVDYERFLGPTATRIAGVLASSDTENISSLAYVQGWQDAWANLNRTHGMGLGFNMMGCHPLPDVPVRQFLGLTGREELNAEDGTFQFGKVVSETGVVGIVFYCAMIWWWIRLERRIRTIPDRNDVFIPSMQAALMFCYISASFVRGGSYFSGGILLWVVAFSGAAKRPFITSVRETHCKGDLQASSPQVRRV